jgi:hypothetical protein
MDIIYGTLIEEHILDKYYTKIFPKNKVVKIKWRIKLTDNQLRWTYYWNKTHWDISCYLLYNKRKHGCTSTGLHSSCLQYN